MVTEPDQPGPPSTRGLLFGSVAESYERHRPGYPDELVDIVLRYAHRPVGTALEVGAGTGKATRLFAARGIEVTALEPDAAMAQVLARTTDGLPVRRIVTTFEAFDPLSRFDPVSRFDAAARFDLVYAAAAWHWTKRATRWAKAVDLLVPGGVLALFGRPGELRDPDLSAAVGQIERELVAVSPAAVQPWSIEEMTATDGLTDVERRDLPRVETTTADDFVARLATVSAYLELAPQQRVEALRQVRAVLPAQVDIDTTVQMVLGRRVESMN